MNIEEYSQKENQKMFADAVTAGVFLGLTVIMHTIGMPQFAVICSSFCFGWNVRSISERVRVVRWISIVQSQEAVIEQLLKQTEEHDKFLNNQINSGAHGTGKA